MVKVFAVIEMVIGILQCLVVMGKFINPPSFETPYLIVLAAGVLSFFLGLGLILKKPLAVELLIFFASGVAFTKILILGGVLSLPEAARILFPKYFENPVSLAYHLALAAYLIRKRPHAKRY